MSVPEHVRRRAEVLAGELRAGGWRRVACIDFARGRWQQHFVSVRDPRVTKAVTGDRSDKVATRFHFADDGVIEVDELTPPLIDDVGREFLTLETLTEAIVQHDDARAWYRAAPAAEEARP
ncbi:hypothetical protein [Rhodoplanes roseus]|uniref:hypothetical protein n=1 Tax=Rhodoplanes roseus TaxID=29409 RepID=UPI0011B3D5A0|nr:hypothetical protein [Rhodoplanes roseus]